MYTLGGLVSKMVAILSLKSFFHKLWLGDLKEMMIDGCKPPLVPSAPVHRKLVFEICETGQATHRARRAPRSWLTASASSTLFAMVKFDLVGVVCVMNKLE